MMSFLFNLSSTTFNFCFLFGSTTPQFSKRSFFRFTLWSSLDFDDLESSLMVFFTADLGTLLALELLDDEQESDRLTWDRELVFEESRLDEELEQDFVERDDEVDPVLLLLVLRPLELLPVDTDDGELTEDESDSSTTSTAFGAFDDWLSFGFTFDDDGEDVEEGDDVWIVVTVL